MSRISNQRIADRFGHDEGNKIVNSWKQSTCEGKEAFDSAQLAARIAKKRKFSAQHYRCPCCGKYHIAGRTGKK